MAVHADNLQIAVVKVAGENRGPIISGLDFANRRRRVRRGASMLAERWTKVNNRRRGHDGKHGDAKCLAAAQGAAR
jgi:hypothetical protein